MSEDIKPEVIKKTQESLSRYIKKPPLTEKLLKKPPFRFLHDIVTSIMKETGYFEGIFAPEELNSENIKDRNSKIAFLEKIITCIKESGISISARPSKIVAGLEVTKTNELLQAIGKALEQKSNKKGPEPRKKSHESNSSKNENQRIAKSPQVNESKIKSNAGSLDSLTRKSRSQRDSTLDKRVPSEERSTDKSKRKEKSRGSKEERPESKSRRSHKILDESANTETGKMITNDEFNQEKPKEKIKVAPNSVNEEAPENQVETNGEVHFEKKPEENFGSTKETELIERENRSHNEPEAESKFESLTKPAEEETISAQPNKFSRPASAASKERVSSSRTARSPYEGKKPIKGKKLDDKEPEGPTVLGGISSPTQQLPKLVRPGSAKRPPSARPGAPRPRDRGEITQIETHNSGMNNENKHVIVIEDTNTSQDDDKENMVVIETQPMALDRDEDMADDMTSEIPHGQEGALLSKILETKKEIERGSEEFPWSASSQPQRVEIDWESGRKRKREAWKKEVEELCEGIQQLTRSTNPLGKLFDFLQEDIDSMQKELQSFVELNEQLGKKLKQEQRISGESIEVLKGQLEDVESMIEAEQEAIRFIKSNIVENEKKIIRIVSRTKN